MRPLTAGVFILLLASFTAFGQLNPADSAAAEKAMAAISPQAIEARMRFLSGAPLEGRGPGTKGYEIAALYVATEMEALGLRPAGSGGWLQQVPLREYKVLPERTSFALVQDGRETPLVFGTDYVTSGDALRTDVSVEAPTVFAGFCVTAPELKYDDYAGVDARGKIVVCLHGAPATFPSSERAYFADGVNKARTAVAHGAVGILNILSPAEQKRYAWKWIAPQVQSGGMRWLDRNGAPHDTFPELRGGGLLSQHGAELLFAGAPKSLDQVFAAADSGAPPRFPLRPTARIRTVSSHQDVQSPNIIGVLRGSDPAARDEYVVLTAHVDHLGTCPPVDGDNVCHGAYDNASGVATLLEVAHAFAAMPQAPRRSILFAFVTGEEKGLLGSDYFANNPTVPLASIVANVNIDGAPGLLYPLKDVVALGAEHSSLSKDVDFAARRLGYEVSPDPMPEEVFFIRSDQYPFVRQGVPAVAISDGLNSTDPKLNGEAITKTWLTTIYHTPRDNMKQPFDFQSAAKGTRLNFLVAYDLAQQAQRPAWNGGDFFGTKFGHGTASAPAR